MYLKRVLIVVFALFCMQGAAFANTAAYSPPDGQYELRYPSGWKAVTDARELELMRSQIGSMMPELKMENTPDVFFISGMTSGMTMASVTRFRLPPELAEIGIDTYLDTLMKQNVGENMRRQRIGEHTFVVHIGSTAGRSHFYYASTIHDGKVISLRFAGYLNMTNEERAIYEDIVASLNFKEHGKSSVGKADETQRDLPTPSKNPAGFWTGLWHGGLVLPRWVLSWFTGAKIYAIYNTGFGYKAGFVIGVILFLTSGGKAKRSH